MRSVRSKALVIVAVAALFSADLAQAAVPQGRKTIQLNDKVSKNQIRFTSSAPMEEIKGTADISGSFSLDPANLEASTGTLRVEVRSMKTGNGTRDKHLYSADWLDADKFPHITFSLTKINGSKVVSTDNSKTVAQGTAVGEFTLHGVSKEITAPVTITYMHENEQTRKRAEGDLVHVKATMKVSLSDFNITGKKGLIGNKVGEVIDIEADLFGNTGK